MKKLNSKSIITGLFLLASTSHVAAEEFQDEFNFFDKNSNGTVSLEEFRSVMMHEGFDDIREEFSDADRDKSKTITFDEAKQFDTTHAEYQRADRDQNGVVNLDEFSHAIVYEMFDEADLNHNDRVDFSEFKQACED